MSETFQGVPVFGKKTFADGSYAVIYRYSSWRLCWTADADDMGNVDKAY